jgi:hypothetical protein
MYPERQFLWLCRRTGIMRKQHQRSGTVGENQHSQRVIVVLWEGLFREITPLQQLRWQQNWIFILETLFPQKLSGVSFTNRASMVRLQLLHLWLLKLMLRCVNGVTTVKPRHQGLETCTLCDQICRHSRCSLHKEEFTFDVHPRKHTIRNAWFQQWNTEEVLPWFGQQYRGILFVPLLFFMAELLQGSTWGWITRCIQMSFLNNNTLF